MILIVGLGNPGQKYQRTRHNLGWAILDMLQTKWKEEHDFSRWKKARKVKAEVSEGMVRNKTIILAKPLTFMNLSGQAVKSLVDYYEIKPKELIIIHDDIDISLGKIRLAENRGSAGHRGIQSIIKELGKNFIRLRAGIKPKDPKLKNVDKFVLLKFNKKEEKVIEKITERTLEAIEVMIKKGLSRAMNKFNKK